MRRCQEARAPHPVLACYPTAPTTPIETPPSSVSGFGPVGVGSGLPAVRTGGIMPAYAFSRKDVNMSVRPLTLLEPPRPAHPSSAAAAPTITIEKPAAGDRVERTSSPHRGFGVGLIAAVSAEAGVAVGAGASASAGTGLFYAGGHDVRPGSFAGAGAFAGPGNHVLGAFAGVGVGAFVSNADSAKQLAGIAQTYSLNVGVGPVKVSLQVGQADGTYIGSMVIGPGVGLDVSAYPTCSVATSR